MLTEIHKKRFNQNGWVKIKGFFSKKEIQSINDKINLFLKKNLKKYEGRDINFSKEDVKLNEINSFHKLSDAKWLKLLAKKKKIKNLSKYFIGSKKPELRACELFAKPAKIGLAAPIHQDNFYWCVKDDKAITAWVAIDDCTKKNGAIFYYNGSHKLGVVEHEPSHQKGSSQKIKKIQKYKKYKIETPNLKTGDCLVHHCLVMHGSTKNISEKSRRGFTFQFKDSNSKYDLKKKKSYEKALKKQVQKRKDYN